MLQGDWAHLTDGHQVDLSGDACPACGCALPLVDGACADCGLQLE
ncbi:MAG: hypothetical protein QM831_26175 [Kofleriaceae bacterium]